MRIEGGIQDVVRIEYDPGRSGHIALLKSRDPGSKQPWSYVLAPEGLRAGHSVQSFRDGIPDNLVPGFVDTGKKGKKGQTGKATSSTAATVAPEEDAGVRIFGSFSVQSAYCLVNLAAFYGSL
jgi:large subunit ribosomal protein L2